MLLLTNVQSNQLPILFIFMAVGITGFVLSMAADVVRNRDLKAIAQEALPFDEEGNYQKQPLPHRKLIIYLNVAGYVFMLVSLIALWQYGYFDKYLAMLFG